MDVKTLCLGALTFGEASGYDIKKFFECTFSHFFVAGYGSIYPALSTLAEQGLVTCRTETQDGKPDRKLYALTREGREAFLQDLAEAPPNHKVRSEFLVQMFFAHLLPRERLEDLFEKRLESVERNLEYIESFLREHEGGACPAEPGALFCAGFGRAVLSAGREFILHHRAEVIESGIGTSDEKASRTKS